MNSPAATEDPRGESVSGELVLRSFVEVQLATETIAPLRTPLHYSPTTPLLSQFTGPAMDAPTALLMIEFRGRTEVRRTPKRSRTQRSFDTMQGRAAEAEAEASRRTDVPGGVTRSESAAYEAKCCLRTLFVTCCRSTTCPHDGDLLLAPLRLWCVVADEQALNRNARRRGKGGSVARLGSERWSRGVVQ